MQMVPLIVYHSFAISVGSWPISRIDRSQAIGQPVLSWKYRPGSIYLPLVLYTPKLLVGKGESVQAVPSPEQRDQHTVLSE